MIEGVLVAVVDENVSDFCRNLVVVEGNVASEIINLDHFDLLGDGISTTVVFAILSSPGGYGTLCFGIDDFQLHHFFSDAAAFWNVSEYEVQHCD